jgi:hypothetical protein
MLVLYSLLKDGFVGRPKRGNAMEKAQRRGVEGPIEKVCGGPVCGKDKKMSIFIGVDVLSPGCNERIGVLEAALP